MTTVTISPNYQIEIPMDIRERLALHPGQKLEMFAFNDRIELIPHRPITELKHSLPGLDGTVEREDDRY